MGKWLLHNWKVTKEIADDLRHIYAVFRLWGAQKCPQGSLMVQNGWLSVLWEVEISLWDDSTMWTPGSMCRKPYLMIEACLGRFCLDEISFRRDYKSCRIGVVVVVVVVVDVVPHLWKLCDFVTFAILELHFWDLVQCFLISFCMGSEILVKIGLP